MGYSGYCQLLCTQGHYFMMDCYQFEFSGLVPCPYCKSPITWWNLVDTTNGPGQPVKLWVSAQATIRECLVCRHIQTIKPTRYRIPTDIGHRVAEPTDLLSGHDTEREEDHTQEHQDTYGDTSRLPGE